MKKIFPFVFFIFLFTTYTLAQFVNVKAEISVDRMPEKERTDLKTLEQLFLPYFENYNWFENIYGIEIPLNINLFPQSVNITGFERVFTAQMFISNQSSDQRFFEKAFKFTYNTNDPIAHTDMPNSLLSVLDFYAWLMIAGEIDTYEPLGGNNAYEKARDIATRAQLSEKPYGWKERLQSLDELLMLRNYRMTKYFYWMIVDLISQEKDREVSPAIDKFLHTLEAMFTENARERYTHIFLDVHARDLMNMLIDYGSVEQREKLMALDPDNKDIYSKLLKTK